MPMQHVRRTALVAHPAERIFAVIEAAEHYPAFLPWCRAATILERSDELVVARLELAWHGLRLGFVTRNPKRAPTWMAIGLEQGPFRHFKGEWQLAPLAAWGCRVEFALDYEFDAALIGGLAAPLFDKAAQTLVDAFVQRADQLPPSAPSAALAPSAPSAALAPSAAWAAPAGPADSGPAGAAVPAATPAAPAASATPAASPFPATPAPGGPSHE